MSGTRIEMGMVSSVNKAKKVLVLPIVLVFALSAGVAQAAPLVVEKKFDNCAALNKVYPGGVSKSAKSANKGGKTKQVPTVNLKVYNENKTKDRDGDGIACER
jgi:hypothetical protein